MNTDKFFDLIDTQEGRDNFLFTFVRIILDESDNWSNDSDEFFSLIKEALNTPEGEALIVAMCGATNVKRLLKLFQEEMELADEIEEDDG
jgi:hypothetical protein